MWLTDDLPSNSEETEVVEQLDRQSIHQPHRDQQPAVNTHNLLPRQSVTPAVRPARRQQHNYLHKLRKDEHTAAASRPLADDVEPTQTKPISETEKTAVLTHVSKTATKPRLQANSSCHLQGENHPFWNAYQPVIHEAKGFHFEPASCALQK